MILKPHELFIKNLRHEIRKDSTAYMLPHEAYATLKRWTGREFGDDADAWEVWVERNAEVFKRPPGKEAPVKDAPVKETSAAGGIAG